MVFLAPRDLGVQQESLVSPVFLEKTVSLDLLVKEALLGNQGLLDQLELLVLLVLLGQLESLDL